MKALLSVLSTAGTTVARIGIAVSAGLLVLCFVLFLFWNAEPDLYDVRASALARVGGDQSRLWPGVVTTDTLIRTVASLLDKPGGYLSNDVLPPGLLMDDMPN